MPQVAVTRLRVRSSRFMPGFAWFTWRSVRQARRAAGNLGVAVCQAEDLAFWTVITWPDDRAPQSPAIAGLRQGRRFHPSPAALTNPPNRSMGERQNQARTEFASMLPALAATGLCRPSAFLS